MTQPWFFLMLDKQSTEDCRVIIMERSHEWVTPEGDKWAPLRGGRGDVTRITVWKRHRVPFDEAFGT
jgi:hypothetical protein